MRIIFAVLLVALIGAAYCQEEDGASEVRRCGRERSHDKCAKYRVCQRGEDGKACKIQPKHIKNLQAGQAELMKDLSAKLGPKAAEIVAKVLTALAKIPALGKVLEAVSKLAGKIIKDCGILDKLLSGGALTKAFNGKNLDRKTQKAIYASLKKIVPSCVACTVTKLVTLLVNGALLSKLPIVGKILPQVGKIIPSLLNILKPLDKVLKPVQKVLTGLLGGLKDKDSPEGAGKLLGIL